MAGDAGEGGGALIPPADSVDVRRRLQAVNDDLAATAPATGVTVGLTKYQPNESLQTLIGRADTALLTARGC